MIRVMEIRQRKSVFDAGAKEVLADVFSTMWNLGCAMVDWAILALHICRRQRNEVAFLVHPPNEYHIFTPWPALRYLPQKWVLWITKWFPPYRLGKLTVRRPDGAVVRGRLFTVTIAPEHILLGLLTKEQITARIRQEVDLARRWGAHYIGMGAYLPALTKQGLALVGDKRFRRVCLTTGHACTARVIKEYLDAVAIDVGIDLNTEIVAVVGAAGSTGTTVSRLLAQSGNVKRMLLVDLPRKESVLAALAKECGAEWATNLDCLPTASVIIVLTTASGSIIEPKHLGPSVVIIDDSKPRNTSPEVLGEAMAKGQALVLDVLAQVPGLEITFHYDLNPDRPEMAYTCLAEVFALAMNHWRDGNFSIGEVPLARVGDMKVMASAAGISRAPYVSFNKPVSEIDLAAFRRRHRLVFRRGEERASM